MAIESASMGPLDRAILAELRSDGRLSWRELGDRVGLGPTATADRVRRLTESGVISGYHAVIDHSAIGIGLRAIVDIRLQSGADPDAFERALAGMPEVDAAYHVTGPFDFLVSMGCADVASLDRLLRGWKAEGAVGETNTRIILNEIGLQRGA